MGVSGCGKSTLGQALAHELGYALIEGDEHHLPASKAKMRVVFVKLCKLAVRV